MTHQETSKRLINLVAGLSKIFRKQTEIRKHANKQFATAHRDALKPFAKGWELKENTTVSCELDAARLTWMIRKQAKF